MNREIKFRAWHTGAMYIVNTLGMTKSGIDKGMCFAHHFAQPEKIMDEGCVIFDDFTEFMQYTGLKDKNRKEIYEGDILKDEEGYSYPIEWESEGACYSWDAMLFSNSLNAFNLEVIGNIYENPELLNK